MSRILTSTSLQPHDPMLVERIATEFSGYHIHGELYAIIGTSQALTVTSTGTYYIQTGWADTGYISTGYITGSAANGTLTIGAKAAGLYMVDFGCCFQVNKTADVEFGIFDGATMLSGTHREEHMIANFHTSVQTHKIVQLHPTDVITVKWTSSVDTTIISFMNSVLTLVWVAGV